MSPFQIILCSWLQIIFIQTKKSLTRDQNFQNDITQSCTSHPTHYNRNSCLPYRLCFGVSRPLSPRSQQVNHQKFKHLRIRSRTVISHSPFRILQRPLRCSSLNLCSSSHSFVLNSGNEQLSCLVTDAVVEARTQSFISMCFSSKRLPFSVTCKFHPFL